MARFVYLLFGVFAYVVFLATFLYLIGFVADLSWLPHSVDRPAPTLPLAAALMLDVALIALFGIQHSVMARAGFKAAWTRIVPEPIERSMFVLVSSFVLIPLFAAWQSVPATLWDLRGTIAAPLLWAVFASGWLIVLLSTFLIDHLELFGLTQVWNHGRGLDPVTPVLRQPLLYRFVRHPLYSGFMIAFWATPHMSYGHLMLAVGMSAYILIAIVHEERDLVRLFGADYEAYRGEVGKLAPRLRRRSPG